MPKITFHILPKISFEESSSYLCQLVASFYKEQQTVYILTDSPALAKFFDDALWTFNDISFIPHVLVDRTIDQLTPIVISSDAIKIGDFKDNLVNLTSKIPNFYGDFSHVIEIVPNDPLLVEAGREKYKSYQQHGDQLTVLKP